MRRLAHLVHKGETTPSLHICGEAYSDYHGFMEGSLRSAVYTLHRILDRKSDGEYKSTLCWLSTALDDKIDADYFDGLRHWVERLDNAQTGPGTHLYRWDDDTTFRG